MMLVVQARVLSRAWIGNHVAGHEPVPNKQHHQRADGRGDEAGTLIRPIMANGLADEGRKKRTGYTQCGCQDEPARIVRAG